MLKYAQMIQNNEPLSIFEQSSLRPIDADLFASSWR